MWGSESSDNIIVIINISNLNDNAYIVTMVKNHSANDKALPSMPHCIASVYLLSLYSIKVDIVSLEIGSSLHVSVTHKKIESLLL
jgi:hypothetical protein